ncbi:hypothetical protein FACS1894168_3240 [Deltaproteobacteria bacterium]|nr:hypothetical protein FACS1894168_3240 [Deltaproteobacteria bacterium]
MPPAAAIPETLAEIRSLFAERDRKQREIDALDQSIRCALGMDAGRPDKSRLSQANFLAACGVNYERISKKKRQPVDCGMVRIRKEEDPRI